MIDEILDEINTWENVPIYRSLGMDVDISNMNHLLTKRVVLVGPTQVGKTTLIMNLIGIRDDKKTELNRILRGGRSVGESSTSIATVYTRSPEGYGFGIKEFNLTENISANSLEYFPNTEGFKERLKSINEHQSILDYENNNKYLCIAIPEEYYYPDNKENIQVVDLPGFGDQREAVRAYLRKVKDTLYNFIAGVIAVAAADKIKELSSVYKEYLGDINPENTLIILSFALSQRNKATDDMLKEALTKGGTEAEKVVREFYNNMLIESENECLGVEYSGHIFPIENDKNYLYELEKSGFEGAVLLADSERTAILDELKKMKCSTSIAVCEIIKKKQLKKAETELEEYRDELKALEKGLEKIEKKRSISKDRYDSAKKKYDAYLKSKEYEEYDKINTVYKKVKETRKKERYPGSFSYREMIDRVNAGEAVDNFIAMMTERAAGFFGISYDENPELYLRLMEMVGARSEEYNISNALQPVRDHWLSAKKYGDKWEENARNACRNILGHQFGSDNINSVTDLFDAEIAAMNNKMKKADIKKRVKFEKEQWDWSKKYKKNDQDFNKKLEAAEKMKKRIQDSEKSIKNIEENRGNIVRIFIEEFNKKSAELKSRIEAETDPAKKAALFMVLSTITYNMKGTVSHYEQKEK